MTTSTHVVLPGSRRYHRAGTQVVGRTDAHEWCEITLKLRRKKELPEPTVGQPALTRAQLIADHGASNADMTTVENVLTQAGLTITERSPTHRTLKAAGLSSTMEALFGVHLLRVQHGANAYRGRVGDIFLPASLKDLVVGVFGLDNRPMARRREFSRSHVTSNIPLPNERSWFLPQELADAYKFPANDGAGQTIAILEFGGHYVAKDLADFATLSGLSKVPSVVTKNVQLLSQRDRNEPGAIGETMLDVEVVAGVCPGATIALYFSNWTEQGWIDALDAALHNNAHPPSVLSISYGLSEGTDIWTGQALDLVNDALKEAAALGIVVCVSAGDDGSDNQVGDGQAHVDFPSASPYVLAVGGTALIKANKTEIVWFDGDGLRQNGGGSTGGGVSRHFPRPSWQSQNISSVNPHAPSGRIVPDVAGNAAGSTGYLMVALGQAQISGGTSASAPLWAALIARLKTAGKAVGYLTPLFYQATPSTSGQPLGAVVCRDITSGNNDTAAAGGYSAQVGYDAVTGWGSPHGDLLEKHLPLAKSQTSLSSPIASAWGLRLRWRGRGPRGPQGEPAGYRGGLSGIGDLRHRGGWQDRAAPAGHRLAGDPTSRDRAADWGGRSG